MTDTFNYSIRLKIEPTENEDEEDLENSTRLLVNELNEINGINNISFVTKEEKIPEGARAGELVSLGEIVMSIITSGALVTSLNLLKSWLENKKRKIKIETKNVTVEAENISKDQIDKIINLIKESNSS
jgi:hypothetical protein